MVTSAPRGVQWQERGEGSVPRSRNRKTPFQRQFTPYRRTPASRRLGLSSQRKRMRSHERQAVDLKELVGKTWRVYKATPLYAFSYQPSARRHYAKLLAAFIEGELRKGVVVDTGEVPDSAEVSVYKGLDVNPQDSEAIQITLKTRSKKDGSMQPVLVGLLVCTDMDEDIAGTISSAFTALPLVLIKGPINLARLLTGWLEVQFDCSISPMVIPSLNLHWMVAMWSGDVPEKRSRWVELCYSPPAEVQSLNRITLNVDPTDCKALWDSIHAGGDRFLETEVATFVKALEAHFYQHFRIHLNAMHLQRVGTAIAYVASDGKLKMFHEPHIQNILAALTELASERVLTL